MQILSKQSLLKSHQKVHQTVQAMHMKEVSLTFLEALLHREKCIEEFLLRDPRKYQSIKIS